MYLFSALLLTWENELGISRSNLTFIYSYYQDLMAGMRAAITAGSFAAFEADFHAAQARGDIEPIGTG